MRPSAPRADDIADGQCENAVWHALANVRFAVTENIKHVLLLYVFENFITMSSIAGDFAHRMRNGIILSVAK